MPCGQSGMLWIFFCLGLRDSRDLSDIASPIEWPGLTAPAPATDHTSRRHGALARRPHLDRTLTSCAAQISPADALTCGATASRSAPLRTAIGCRRPLGIPLEAAAIAPCAPRVQIA